MSNRLFAMPTKTEFTFTDWEILIRAPNFHEIMDAIVKGLVDLPGEWRTKVEAFPEILKTHIAIEDDNIHRIMWKGVVYFYSIVLHNVPLEKRGNSNAVVTHVRDNGWKKFDSAPTKVSTECPKIACDIRTAEDAAQNSLSSVREAARRAFDEAAGLSYTVQVTSGRPPTQESGTLLQGKGLVIFNIRIGAKNETFAVHSVSDCERVALHITGECKNFVAAQGK
jgi:hypothetical protein